MRRQHRSRFREMTSQQDLWLVSPKRPVLNHGEVHVWRVRLGQPSSTVRAFSNILTLDEKERASAYSVEKDRDHFVVARGALRNILSLYLHVLPTRILLCSNDYGKPSVSGQTGDRRLRFNLSHSHGVALLALTRSGEIGVDVEFIREEFAGLAIAESLFSPIEVSRLKALPPDIQVSAFFKCWTRKEAYIKARGEGLSHPLNEFVVSFIPGEPAALVSTARNPGEASQWSLLDVHPDPNYVGAIAVNCKAPTLHQWKLLE
jgi:4'-phosphopantetheinyl transferase